MRLSAVVIFLVVWSAVFCLVAVAGPTPGILVRLSERGIQFVAKKVMEWVDSKVDSGMRFPDQKGTFNPSVGSADYSLTEIQARNFSWYRLTGGIVPGVGVMVSFHKIGVSVNGNFKYTYTVMYIPMSNSGTFNLTLSDVSLFVNATAGKVPGGQPTVDFTSCSASIGNIDLQFQAETANYILNLFSDTIKGSIKSTLIDEICKAVKNGQDQLVKEIAKNTRPCIDKPCNLLIDLRFVSPPVFGKDFVETAHNGRIFWKNEASPAPFDPLPFQRLPLSSKMVDFYASAYVLNTLMHTLHRNDRLSYELTKDDLPGAYRNVMNTSCDSFCIGKILPGVFSRLSEATVELDFVASRAPFLNISAKSCSIAFGGSITIQARQPDGSVTEVGVLTLDGSVSVSAFVNNADNIVFKITDISVINASISDKETDRKDVKETKDLSALLHSAAMDNLLPKLNELGQRGISILHFGRVNASRPSLKLIQNALVLMSDVVYTRATAKSALSAA